METMTDLQVGAYGAQLTTLKVYNFTLTDTGSISSTGSTGGGPNVTAGDRIYTIGGMTSQEVPIALVPSTGPFGFGAMTSPGPLTPTPRFNATSTGPGQLAVSWLRTWSGTSATATGAVATTTGVQVQLFTLGIYAPAISTTT
jgi:hypothetical protein